MNSFFCRKILKHFQEGNCIHNMYHTLTPCFIKAKAQINFMNSFFVGKSQNTPRKETNIIGFIICITDSPGSGFHKGKMQNYFIT